MSIKVMTYVWEHSQQKGSALLTLLAIADHADDEGVAYPSIHRIAMKTRMTDRNTQLLLKVLQGSKELKILENQGPHGCHLFQLVMKTFQGEKFSSDKTSSKPIKSREPSIQDKKLDENFSDGAKSFQGEKSGKKTHQISPESSLEPSEEKKEDSLPPVESAPQPFTPLDLLALYNTEAPAHCPRARALTPDREKKARACLKLFPAEAFWREVFAQAQQSPLLRGETVSSTHPNWRADFMWFVGKGKDGTENCLKVVEGKYADHPLDGVLSAKGQRSVANAQRILQEQRHGHDGAGFLALLPEPHRAR